jgi:hypothetical protein
MVSILFYYTINIYWIMFFVYDRVFNSTPFENTKYISYGLIFLDYPPLQLWFQLGTIFSLSLLVRF